MRSLRRMVGNCVSPGCRITERDESENERGATLMLALVYMLVVSAIIGALSYWTANDALNGAHFAKVDAQEIAYTNAVNVAMQSMRDNPPSSGDGNSGHLTPCWGSGSASSLDNVASGLNVTVWCSTTSHSTKNTTKNGTKTTTKTTKIRTVTYSACPSSLSASACADNPNLNAVVMYTDYSTVSTTGGTVTAGNTACTTTCGASQTVEQWSWRN